MTRLVRPWRVTGTRDPEARGRLVGDACSRGLNAAFIGLACGVRYEVSADLSLEAGTWIVRYEFRPVVDENAGIGQGGRRSSGDASQGLTA
jgi:hypothetical protein